MSSLQKKSAKSTSREVILVTYQPLTQGFHWAFTISCKMRAHCFLRIKGLVKKGKIHGKITSQNRDLNSLFPRKRKGIEVEELL